MFKIHESQNILYTSFPKPIMISSTFNFSDGGVYDMKRFPCLFNASAFTFLFSIHLCGSFADEPAFRSGVDAVKSPLINIYDPSSYKHRAPILILHRGGFITPESPECSLRAIELAAERGYEMVELDVQESKDHVPILFHDDTMQKACGMDKVIADFTADEVTKIKFKNSDQFISTLDAALALCEKLHLGVMLDIKFDGSDLFYQTIADSLETYHLTNATVSICTFPKALRYLQGKAMPCLGQEEMKKFEADNTVSLKGKFWFGWPRRISNEMVKKIQAAGGLVIPSINTFHYPVGSPYNAEADIRRMLEVGVDAHQIDSVYEQYYQN
ncbi:MAG: hypothetical protein C4527_02460 [Candidatus Omnitrophota bacterium]|nr:MAG: hypothetical protein C4527_02460 [Candidatus Omnitrophota bacterium]